MRPTYAAILVIFVSRYVFAHASDPGIQEIFITVQGVERTFIAARKIVDDIVWDDDFDIANSNALDGGSITTSSSDGWHFVHDYNGANSDTLGYGLYTIFESQQNGHGYFYLDLRSCDYVVGCCPPTIDMTFKYNTSTEKFECGSNTACDGDVIANGTTLTVWYLKDLGSQDVDCFQPTPPENLTLSDQNNHPKLTWDAGSQPSGGSFTYQVRRKRQSYGTWATIASGITSTSYVDSDLEADNPGGPTWYYKVRARSSGGNYSDYSNQVSTDEYDTPPGRPQQKILALNPTPKGFALQGNHPNPLNPTTIIEYHLPERSYVEMTIYDMIGREIRTLVSNNEVAGIKNIAWDGRNSLGNPVSSGMYLYRFDAISRESDKEFHMTRKMLLLR